MGDFHTNIAMQTLLPGIADINEILVLPGKNNKTIPRLSP